jgi:polygalacturonase
MNRRAFLTSATAAQIACGAEADPEAAILARIQAPEFRKRDFDGTRFGARGDGSMNCAGSIRKAIDACSEAGSGRVIVPPGVFLTGAIRLKTGVNLHVSEGATLRFGRDPKDYLPVVFSRLEGMECMNYSPFLYAFEQMNIAITGGGTLDGQADCEHWWSWKGKAGCFISDVTSGKCHDALSLRGYASSPIRNVHVTNCTFEHAAKPNAIEHVEGVELNNVRVNGKPVVV